MNIRDLSPTDLPAIASLADEAEREGFRFLVRFLSRLERGEARLDGAAVTFLGCFDRDMLVGLGGVTPDPYVPSPEVGRVRHVYVCQSHRRRGHGRQLMHALEERQVGRYAALRLRTDTTAAAKFYEELGYNAVQEATATHVRVLAHARP